MMVIMRLYDLSLFFVLLLLLGCINRTSNKEAVYTQQTDMEKIYDFNDELPAIFPNKEAVYTQQTKIYDFNGELPAMFPNIDDVCKYFEENIKDNKINYNDIINKLHNCFRQTEVYGMLGYNWYGGIVIADINNDGIFELYLNGSTGSGIVHSFIHCYDPAREKYYIVSERFEIDYIAFVHRNNIYIYGNTHYSIKDDKKIRLFEPSFINENLVFEELETNLYNEIIQEFDFKNIYRLFSYDLTRDNWFNK
jgi:hypothetical protein